MADLGNIHPLQVNPETGEVYLQLPAPHSNIRITPPRLSDVDGMVEHMNDPRIYEFFASPPFPYTQQHGLDWSARAIDSCKMVLEDLAEGNQFVNGCPVRSIREVQEDGSDVFIGDIGIMREFPDSPWIFGKEPDNGTKEVGDPTILWTIGGNLCDE